MIVATEAQPRRPARVDMVWKDLLFMHWPVDATHAINRRTGRHPRREGMGGPRAFTGSRPAQGLPRVPGFTRFHECNGDLRAATECPVWFFSLDAANPVTV